MELRMILRSTITARSLATSGQTASNLPAASGAGVVNCTRIATRKGIHLPPQHAATAGWWKEKNTIPPIIRAAEKEVAENTQDYNRKGVLFEPHHSRHVLHGGALRQDRGMAAVSDTSGGSGRCHHNGTEDPCSLTPTQTADNKSVSLGP
jgi:hypothetical protein